MTRWLEFPHDAAWAARFVEVDEVVELGNGSCPAT